MTDSDAQRAAQFYAQTYDSAVPDWPGEIDFYRQLSAQASAAGRRVLEVARQKSAGMPNMRWVQADMRSLFFSENGAIMGANFREVES